jgi:hypothetical protein
MIAAGVSDTLPCFARDLTFYLPTVVGRRLEQRCRVEGVLDPDGTPALDHLADLTVLEEGGGAFTVDAIRRVIDGADRDLSILVREIYRSQLLLAGHFAAAGAL